MECINDITVKRQLMESFIESIELYPEKIKGHLVKSINFNFAISYNGSTTTQIFLPKNTSVETADKEIVQNNQKLIKNAHFNQKIKI